MLMFPLAISLLARKTCPRQIGQLARSAGPDRSGEVARHLLTAFHIEAIGDAVWSPDCL